jgi:hypothetical protein
MKKRILSGGIVLAALGIAASTQAAKGTIDAATMTITIYKFAVAPGPDCLNPTVVFSDDAGVASDLLASPTYGAGQVDPGTYECVLIEMSKVIQTSASMSSGSCVAASVFSDVICRDGQAAQLIDGTPVVCNGDAADPQHVTLFITTASAGMGGDRALLPPASATDTTSGLALTSPLVVTGDAAVTLTVDPRQFLDGTSSVCTTSAPSFGVR